MDYRSLGNSGLRVSVAGLGCNNFGMRIDYEKTVEVIDAAIESGINFLDTARMYGGGKSEEFMGKLSKASAIRSSSRRSSAGRPSRTTLSAREPI